MEAATTPGTFGHGVPGLYGMTSQDLLLVFDVAAIGGILVYVIVNHLLDRTKERTTKSDQWIASAA